MHSLLLYTCLSSKSVSIADIDKNKNVSIYTRIIQCYMCKYNRWDISIILCIYSHMLIDWKSRVSWLVGKIFITKYSVTSLGVDYSGPIMTSLFIYSNWQDEPITLVWCIHNPNLFRSGIHAVCIVGNSHKLLKQTLSSLYNTENISSSQRSVKTL